MLSFLLSILLFQPTNQAPNGAEYLTNQMLVRFELATAESDVSVQCAALEAALREWRAGLNTPTPEVEINFEICPLFPHYNKELESKDPKYERPLGSYFLVKMDASGVLDSAILARAIAGRAAILAAEPNWIVASTDLAKPVRKAPLPCPSPSPIHSPGSAGPTSQPLPVIAVLDSGIDANHPLFCQRLWLPDHSGVIVDFVNNDGVANDNNGHGTQVAGIVAEHAPNFNIMALKVLTGTGQGSYADIARALDFAYREGVAVINMSFGSSAGSPLWQLIFEGISEEVVLVAGAGNDGLEKSLDPFFPAAYSSTLGVEAMDDEGETAGFSNYGYGTAAPGVNIKSAIPGGGQAFASGTSMASPYVAAIAARLVVENRFPPGTARALLRANKSDPDAALHARGTQLALNGIVVGGQPLNPAWATPMVLENSCVSIGVNVSVLDAGETGDVSLGLYDSFGEVLVDDQVVSGVGRGDNIDFTFNLEVGASLANQPLRLVANSRRLLSLELASLDLSVLSPFPATFHVILEQDKTYLLDGITRVSGDLVIPAGTTLYYADQASLEVAGKLSITGTPEAPVTFEPAQHQAQFAGIVCQGASNQVSGSHFIQNPNVDLLGTAITSSGGLLELEDCYFFGFDKAVVFKVGTTVKHCFFRSNRYGIYGVTVPASINASCLIRGNTFVDHEVSAIYLGELATVERIICRNNFFKQEGINPYYPYDVTIENQSNPIFLGSNFWDIYNTAMIPAIIAGKTRYVNHQQNGVKLQEPHAYLEVPYDHMPLFVARVLANGNPCGTIKPTVSSYPIELPSPGGVLDLEVTFSQQMDPLSKVTVSLVETGPQTAGEPINLVPITESWQITPPVSGVFTFGSTYQAQFEWVKPLAEGIYQLTIQTDKPSLLDRDHFTLTVSSVGGVAESLASNENFVIWSSKQAQTSPPELLDAPLGLKTKRCDLCTLETMDDPAGYDAAGRPVMPHRLTWGNTEDGYNIFRTGKQGLLGERINGPMVHGGQFFDYNVDPGKTYFYTVRRVAEEDTFISSEAEAPKFDTNPDWHLLGSPTVTPDGTVVLSSVESSEKARAFFFWRTPDITSYTITEMETAGDTFTLKDEAVLEVIKGKAIEFFIRVVDHGVMLESTTACEPHQHSP